jgi:bla regulator protein BlaR1
VSALVSPLATWAIEALVASALLMALVLAVRVPVRRAFGPRVAYALWSLPVLRLMMPPIPSAWRQAVTETPISRVGETITVVILPGAASIDPVGTASAMPSLSTVLLIAWAIVAAGFLAFHLAHHLTFCRRILARGVTVDRIARVRVIESDAAAGPMAFGIVRPCVAFPKDFAERFDADERALALAHELGHHARGDLVANWIALAVLSLHWFNPLAPTRSSPTTRASWPVVPFTSATPTLARSSRRRTARRSARPATSTRSRI